MVNPLAGVLTDTLSWRAAHAVPAMIALCVLASVRAAPGGSATGAPGVGRGLRSVFAEPSARRWVVAELIAFFGWAASLTFIGAFLIERHGVAESAVGLLLALGAGAFFLSSTRSASLTERFPLRGLCAVAALGTGVFIALQFNAAPALWVTVVLFCVGGIWVGIRTLVSGSLGLSQLPDRPGSMMAARTAAIQTGYLLGGLLGGATLAWGGYGALGLVLGAGMAVAAVLVLRVADPPSREAAEPAVAVGNEGRS